ncbi:MAG: YcxB family protein [Myxococcales bacterium]|nr:YcxB family protein [Myxococcales bacterium]
MRSVYYARPFALAGDRAIVAAFMETDATAGLEEDAEDAGASLGAVTATIELTEGDYVEAYLGYARHKNQIKPLQKLIGVVLGVTAVVVMLSWPVAPGIWTAMAALLAAGLFLVRYQWVHVGKRAFRNLHEKRRRYEVRLDGEGRFAKGPRAEVRSAWSTASEWFETDRVIVLLSPQGLVDLFPKRAFDEARLTTLRALFGACIVAPPAPVTATQVGTSSARKTLLLWLALVSVFVAIYFLVTRSS